MSIIVNGVELTEVIYAGVNLDTVKVKKGTAEAVTVFEKITQLATPQNVTANGTTVSWDAVENATSYAVLADDGEIGTVEGAQGYHINIIKRTGYADYPGINYYKVNGIASSTNYDGYVDTNGILHGTTTFTNAKTISSFLSTGSSGERMTVNGVTYYDPTNYEDGTEIEITSNQDIAIWNHID